MAPLREEDRVPRRRGRGEAEGEAQMGRKWALDDRAQLHKDANKALDENLAPGEQVRAIIRGAYDSAMIATDRRAFVFKKGAFGASLFGKKLASYDYRNLTGVQIETGVISGAVALQGGGIEARDLSNYSKDNARTAPFAIMLSREHFDQAREALPVLRQLISDSQAPSTAAAAAPATDVMEQLRKLGELRDAGILTPTEFDAKKAGLLARM